MLQRGLPTVQCEEGWTEFEARCYYFSKVNANSWNEAAQTCHNLNFLSTLTSVTSGGQLEFILSKKIYYLGRVLLLIIFTSLQLTQTSMTRFSLEELTRILKGPGVGLTTNPGVSPTFQMGNLTEAQTRTALRW